MGNVTELREKLSDLERKALKIDAELNDDALPRLALGEITDEDVSELRAKRARVEDRLDGLRTLLGREEERERNEQRQAKVDEFQQLIAQVDEAAWLEALKRFGEEAAKFAEPAAELFNDIQSSVRAAHENERRATWLARDLGLEMPHVPAWGTEQVGVFIARVVRKALLEGGPMHVHAGRSLFSMLTLPVLDDPR